MPVDVTATRPAPQRPGRLWVERGDRARVVASPLIALLVSGLLVCSLVTLPDAALRWRAIAGGDSLASGWAALAVVVALCTAVLGLLVGGRLGPGPSVALGGLLAPTGLALSQDIGGEAQLVVAQLILAVAVGGLFAGGVGLLDGLPARVGSAAFLAFLFPIAGGWGVVEWLALHDPGPSMRIGVHPPALVLALVAVLLLAWALLALAVGPPLRFDFGAARWLNAWAALGVVLAGSLAIAMLVGFQDEIAPSWGRPVVLLMAGVATAGLLCCAVPVPPGVWRAGYLAVVVALLCGPSCVGVLLLVPALGRGPLSGWILVALAASGAVGVVLGTRRPAGRAGGWVVGGLLLMAGSAAGGWVLPANQWVMLAAAAPMCLGIAATTSAGLALALVDRLALRYLGVAGLAALLLGLLGAVPLAWALGVGFSHVEADARAGGRLLLGLTFALAVLAAAGCAVLLDRAGPSPGAAAPEEHSADGVEPRG